MPLHQSGFQGGGMVPHRQLAVQPLLPYEKRLIDLLGCDEEQYRRFADEVALRSRERPIEYAHIPDIQNAPAAPALISLAIGIAFTAVSYFLAPKPKAPVAEETTRFRTRQLGSKTGTEIFSPSYGFDSLQELAAYGNTVPIVFTRMPPGAYDSGGILISPSLVWSRMKSFGGYQVVEVIAIAGQGPMDRPELAGIFLGNNALDGIYSTYFDFYWNSGEAQSSRLKGRNLRYGTLPLDDGFRDAPDDESFYAPTLQGANQPAFSSSFTPTSQTRFGVFSGIPNGTPYRPDWKIVQPLQQQEDEQRDQALTEQQKYVDGYLMKMHPFGNGDLNDGSTRAGMPGTGTNYSRHIGILEHVNAQTGVITSATRGLADVQYSANRVLEKWSDVTQEVDVIIGDEIVVALGYGRQDQEPFPILGDGTKRPDLGDIRSALDSEMQRYDQIMSLGQTFMIGRSTWQVIDRPRERFNPDVHSGDGFRIRMRCLEGWSRNQRKIGLVARTAIRQNDYLPADIEESYYPILRYEIGTLQNTRPCDVTEIGIKSRVWARINNMTNFNTLPSPGRLARFNEDNIQAQEGKTTSYVRRISLFALDVRYSNNTEFTENTDNEGWTNLGPYLFGVIGSAPIDIYSFIRITHPSRDQYEFRLRPFNSAIPTQQSAGDTDVFILDGSKTPYKDWSFSTYLGEFRIGGRGYFEKPRDIFTHPQMVARPDLLFNDAGEINLIYGEQVADTSKIDVSLESVIAQETKATYQQGEAALDNTLSNMMSIFFGEDPWRDNLANGSRRTKAGFNYTVDSNRTVNVEITVESYDRSYAHTSRNRWWRIVSLDVASFTGNWANGDTFIKKYQSGDGVQFGFTFRISIPTIYQEFDEPQSATRIFERYSGIAEVSHYGDLITRSCDDSPEHEVVYVNECLSEENVPRYEKCAVAGLKLKSSDNFTQLDQLRCYIQRGIEVERLIDNDVDCSNLLTDLLWYFVTNTDTGIGTIINSALVDREELTTTGRYLRANKLFFDDAIAEPVNLRSWLARVAPSVLCYTTIKNGKLSIEPALPYHADGVIDTTRPVPIAGMFTDGNILEDSFEVDWLELEDRKLFQAAILFRQSRVNEFPSQRTVVVRYKTDDRYTLPIEEFEFTHITNIEHALKTARYFLSVRKHQTHTITFRTLPWGLSLAPGQYIRVASEISPYNPANNGIVKADGTVIAAQPLSNGSYSVYYWNKDSENVSEGTMTVTNGATSEFRDTVFSVKGNNQTSQVYQIESLDVDQDGIVTITASNYPVDSSGRSVIAREVLNVDDDFETVGGQ